MLRRNSAKESVTMSAAVPSSCCRSPVAALLVGLLLLPGSSRADEPAPQGSDGTFISVHYPIDDKETARIIELTSQARQQFQNRWKAEKLDRPPQLTIVYDFNPDGKPAGSSQYGSCLDLAAKLLGGEEFNGILTIAFVHGEVTGHAVLPVLACRELVMGKDAKLGDAARHQREPIRKDQLDFYRLVAEKRGRSPALVLKMIDKDLEIFQATRNGSVLFVTGNEPVDPDVVVDRTAPLIPRGTIALYTAKQAVEDFKLCRLRFDTREEVADWYNIPRSAVRENPLLGRIPDAVCIEVRGQLSRLLGSSISRRLSSAVAMRANFVVLKLECGGGSASVAADLAEQIRELSARHQILTVAYLTEHASDLAAVLALSCTQTVMHDKARLGGFDAYFRNRTDDQRAVAAMLEGTAEQRYYPPLLARALADPNLVLWRVKNPKNPLQRNVVSDEQLRSEPDKWSQEGNEPLTRAGKYLTLDATTARELGLAQHVVASLDEVYALYRIDPQTVRAGGPDWLDRFAAFLRLPVITFLLVGIGIACLILELKLPGIGLPGVTAGICFILFFWAHAGLGFTWLAVLLFVLGLVFLAVEIFVTPGFGVLGISGIVLLLAGLGLATIERWPQSESDWIDVASNMGQFGLTLIGGVIAAMIVGRYLPYIPIANRLVLVPPTEKPGDGEAETATAHPRADLLGAIGVTATPLRPAGMVRFGDEYVDVIADGGYVQPGARVQVIEIEGNRIVVKEVG
jgi:membrane-bound ClpP family serine protease